MSEFQSTHPVWGATPGRRSFPAKRGISIHAPRVGCDGNSTGRSLKGSYFNPRTPCGVRRLFSAPIAFALRFQSTHPVWGATWPFPRSWFSKGFQSTHPVWGATGPPLLSSGGKGFQSTHPVWGATKRWGISWTYAGFQSTHPVWGATLCQHFRPRELQLISIHAPRVGCDCRT